MLHDFTCDQSISNMTKDNFSSEVYEDRKQKEFSFEFDFVLPYMSMLMSHTSLLFFVLSFVLACAYLASEEHA